MLLLHIILPFYPKLHKMFMSRVMNYAEKGLWKLLELYLKYFEIYFEISSFDVELMTVSLIIINISPLKL